MKYYVVADPHGFCGYLRQADCHGAFEASVRPYVNPRTLRRIVSDHDRRNMNVQV